MATTKAGFPAPRTRSATARKNTPIATPSTRRLTVLADGSRAGRGTPVGQCRSSHAQVGCRSWTTAHKNTAATAAGWCWTYFCRIALPVASIT